MTCAFCDIAAGTVAAHVVHEDDACIAFLDRSPLFLGHVLLAPRAHVRTLPDLPLAATPAFLRLAQRLDVAVQEAMGAEGTLNIVNNVVSQSVPHLHLHVIPRRRKDGLRFWLGPRTRYRSDADAAQTAASITDALRRTGD